MGFDDFRLVLGSKITGTRSNDDGALVVGAIADLVLGSAGASRASRHRCWLFRACVQH